MDPGLAKILRAFGTTTTKVDSTYSFLGGAGQGVKAGDDIDICHVSTGGAAVQEPKTCPTTAITDSTHVISADTPSVLVNLTIYTDVAWTGGAPGSELDDPSMSGGVLSTDIHQIFLRTNGDVTDTELVGDMLVGSIESTQHDVTLNSLQRILDANHELSIDVTGVNITMTAGTGGTLGGVGLPTDFLEINVAVVDGVTGALTVTDTASSNTLGVFVTEIGDSVNGTTDDLRVHLVKTKGDVSLVTDVLGSIIDANNDSAADVIGNNIDLKANGGSIGAADGTNDLDIDSSRWQDPSNVQLPGTPSYVTSTTSGWRPRTAST